MTKLDVKLRVPSYMTNTQCKFLKAVGANDAETIRDTIDLLNENEILELIEYLRTVIDVARLNNTNGVLIEFERI